MPGPVSRTDTWNEPLLASALIATSPVSVNLMALPTRLIRTCVKPRSFRRHVQNVDRLSCIDGTINAGRYSTLEDRRLTTELSKVRGCVMHCDALVGIAFPKQHVAKCRLANAGRVLQDCIKNRLQIAGGTADDLKHFRCGRLLL